MAQQQVEGPREAGGRGLVPREQERHQLVADLRVVHRAAVLEARGHQHREDVLARVGAALGDLLGEQRVDLARERSRRASGSGPPKRRDSSTPNCRPADDVLASRRPSRSASRARRPGSVTPNTARRITSSVIDCMRGWIANGTPDGPALDVARHRVAHDRLVRAHALPVERRKHQPAAREVLAPLEQQQRPRAHDRTQRHRPPGRQPVLADAVERSDRIRVREHHHRRLEAEEAHAERVAEPAAAGFEERDRPQQPAQRLERGRLGRAGGSAVMSVQGSHQTTRAGVGRPSPNADGRSLGSVAERDVVRLRVEVVELQLGPRDLRRAHVPDVQAASRVALVDEAVVPVRGPVTAAEVRAAAGARRPSAGRAAPDPSRRPRRRWPGR